ncbi:MAG: Na/Pi cotransporter family protein [Candidatus Edwardsbacteria bacterium]|nr:Na/Pi cotransporter family protein [Candidatus Edwardsbacteria bacterium]
MSRIPKILLLGLAAGLFSMPLWGADHRISKAVDALGSDVSGDRQAVTIGKPAGHPLVVQITDARGRPVAGARVVFLPVGEGTAQLEPDTAVSDLKGNAISRIVPQRQLGNIYVQAQLAADPRKAVTFSFNSYQNHWWLISLLGAVGGLVLFLFGIRFCSRGLQKAAGTKLKQMLWSLTDNRFKGLGVGILVTAIVQSSTATTVMLVSLTNAGLISLSQVLGVILGADIGTTITVQLIAFKLSDYCLALVVAGFLAMMLAGKRPWRYYPQIVFGFGLIFFGMKLTADSLLPLKSMPWFLALFAGMGSLPLLGVLIGVMFTLLVRSSAVTIGIMLTLAFQDLIALPAAMPIIIGANIGTCGAALMAAWGGNQESIKVAWGHTIFKVLAGIAALIFIAPFIALVQRFGGDAARQIANAHTIFNVLASLLFLPWLKPFGKFLNRMIPMVSPEQKTFAPKYLDDRALETPSLAIGQVSQELLRMADLVRDMLVRSCEVLEKNDISLRNQLVADDDKVDLLEEAITPFVVKITQEDLSGDQSSRGVELLYIVNDIENIGDVISKNIMGHAAKKIEQHLAFSEEGLAEIRSLYRETLATLDLAIGALASGDLELARNAHNRKDQVLALEKELYKKHLGRLQAGFKESRETSTMHLDLLSDFERINFHASQIGAALLGRAK